MWEVFALLVGAQTRRTENFPVSEHTMRSDKECGPGDAWWLYGNARIPSAMVGES